MITDNTKQVSSKQLVMLTFILCMSVKLFMLPILLLKESGRDSYVPIIIALIAEIICLSLMLYANKRCPDETFFGFMQRLLTKVGAKILSALLLIYFLAKLFLIISELKIFFTVSVFENLPWPIFIIPLLVLLFAMTKRGINGIARTSEIFTPFILIAVVAMFLLMVTNVDFDNLLPFMQNGLKPIGKSLFKFPMWYGDFSVFIVFLGKIKRTKHTSKASVISAIITSCIVLAFSLMIFAAYANVNLLVQYGQNVSSLTQITLTANSLGRLDIMLFAIWMISVIIKAAVVFAAASLCLQYLFLANKSAVSGAVIAVFMYLLSVIIFPNELIFRAFIVDYASIPVMIIMYIIPITVFVSALITKKGAIYAV